MRDHYFQKVGIDCIISKREVFINERRETHLLKKRRNTSSIRGCRTDVWNYDDTLANKHTDKEKFQEQFHLLDHATDSEIRLEGVWGFEVEVRAWAGRL